MAKNLITNEQILRENLDVIAFDFDDSTNFLIYHMFLLQNAFNMNIINEEMRNLIEKNVVYSFFYHIGCTNELDLASASKKRAFSNAEYILSCRLKEENSHFNALKILVENFANADLAKTFLNDLFENFYMTNYLKRVKEKIDYCESEARKFNKESLNLVIDFFKDNLSKMRSPFGENAISFKGEHNSDILTVSYTFFNDTIGITGSTYLEKFENIVKAFVIELSILRKLKKYGIISEIDSILKNLETLSENTPIDIYRRELEEQLKNLEKWKKEMMLNYFEQQTNEDAIINQKYDEFKNEHPELSEKELECAFDSYLDNFFSEDESEYLDEVEIEKTYKARKEEINEKLTTLDSTTYEIEMLYVEFDPQFNLKNYLKDFSICRYCEKNGIDYPSDTNFWENSRIEIENYVNSEDLIEFLQNCKLSHGEIEYLLKKC